MAVTRVFQTGFELQNHGYDGLTLNTHDSTFYSYVTGSPSPNTGNAALKLARPSATNGIATINVSATTQLRVNFWLYIPTGTAFDPDGILLFSFLNSVATTNSTALVLSIQMNATGFRAWAGNNILSLLDSSSTTFIYDAWVPIGIDVYADNSSGYLRLWYNGTQELDFSGDTVDLNSTINMVGFSSYWNSDGLDTASDFVYYDDLTIWDTTGESVSATPPDYKRYYWMAPNGDGNYSQWVGQDGDSLNNYQNVDEIPPDDDTTYNVSGTSTNRDSYAMSNVSLDGSETPDAVIPVAVARGDGSASTLTLFVRQGGTNQDGSAQNIGTSYGTIWERFSTDPGGGAWDETEVNATEVGVLVP